MSEEARPAEYASMSNEDYAALSRQNIENINLLRRDHGLISVVGIGMVVVYYYKDAVIGVTKFETLEGFIWKKRLPLAKWETPNFTEVKDEYLKMISNDMKSPYRDGDKFVLKEVSAAELQEIGWQFIKDNVAAALTNPAGPVTMTAPSTKEK